MTTGFIRSTLIYIISTEYGISVSEAQTFLLAKRPKRQGERRNGCIHELLCF